LTAGKNADAGLTYSGSYLLTFQHHIAKETSAVAVYGRAWCTVRIYLLSPFKSFFLMPDFPSSCQSGTGMDKKANTKTSLVPD
jgi:hypothetical protein